MVKLNHYFNGIAANHFPAERVNIFHQSQLYAKIFSPSTDYRCFACCKGKVLFMVKLNHYFNGIAANHFPAERVNIFYQSQLPNMTQKEQKPILRDNLVKRGATF